MPYNSEVNSSPNGQIEVEFRGSRGSGSVSISEPTGHLEFYSQEDAIRFFSELIKKIKATKT